MNKTIQQRAEEKYPLGDLDYADSTKIMTRAMMVVSQEAYTTGATDQSAIMQPEIDRLQERVKELEEGLKWIIILCEENGEPVDGFKFRENVLLSKELLTKTQTP